MRDPSDEPTPRISNTYLAAVGLGAMAGLVAAQYPETFGRIPNVVVFVLSALLVSTLSIAGPRYTMAAVREYRAKGRDNMRPLVVDALCAIICAIMILGLFSGGGLLLHRGLLGHVYRELWARRILHFISELMTI